jgi:hypothetical protein
MGSSSVQINLLVWDPLRERPGEDIQSPLIDVLTCHRPEFHVLVHFIFPSIVSPFIVPAIAVIPLISEMIGEMAVLIK